MMAALIGVHGAGNPPENKECWSWLAPLDHQDCGRSESRQMEAMAGPGTAAERSLELRIPGE
jgi:hypothetical protein